MSRGSRSVPETVGFLKEWQSRYALLLVVRGGRVERVAEDASRSRRTEARSLWGGTCGEQHGDQHCGVGVVMGVAVDRRGVGRASDRGEGEVVTAERAARGMRRKAVGGDRPGPVAALAEAASVPRHVPVTSVEQVALNGAVESGADDPVDVVGVVAVVEGEQIEIAALIRRRRSFETIEPVILGVCRLPIRD